MWHVGSGQGWLVFVEMGGALLLPSSIFPWPLPLWRDMGWEFKVWYVVAAVGSEAIPPSHIY